MTSRLAERGQSTVEFALAALAFFALLFGVIDFGRLLYAYDQVGHAARVGTRYAMNYLPSNTGCSVSGGTCQSAIVSAIVAKTLVNPARLRSTITYGGTSPGCASVPVQGCYVTVTLQYSFNFALMPFATETLTSTSQAVLTAE